MLETWAVEISKQAAYYNIFEVLRVERREVLTHSAFLAHLFDPAGSHAQGNLFLQCLFRRLKSKGIKYLPALRPDQTWIVETEQRMDTGRLDIVICNYSLGTRLVIENKIGARDQEQQLERYHRQMLALRHTFKRCRCLVYLTLDGHSCKEADDSEEKPEYIPLSYEKDILSILDTALTARPEMALSVKHLLIQYNAVVKNLK